MRLLAFLISFFCGTVVNASGVPLLCGWDHSTEKLSAFKEGLERVETTWAGDGFVSYQVGWGGIPPDRVMAAISVIHNCTTDSVLKVENSTGKGVEATVLFEQMVSDNRGYTFVQIGEAMAELGSFYSIEKNSIGTCACGQP